MPPGIKQELGLGDPSKPAVASTQQADKFKADYQAAAGPINQALQYTAAHAQKTKHDPEAGKRDKSCQAYQAALSRIDPTNPAKAQSAIDQVLAAVQGLKSTVESLKAAVEKAFNAWTAKEPTLQGITDKVREMVEWGHTKASALQQVVDAIVKKANDKAYEDACQGVDQLSMKVEPIHEDYLKQKAAQAEYEPARQNLQGKLDEAQKCPFKSLDAQKQELTTGVGPMDEAASTKNYVDALSQLRTLEQKVTDFLAKVVELEAKKAEYETARAAVDPKLAEASTCQFKSLAELDQQIADLTTKTDAAAGEEKYDDALASVNELTTKVDEKVAKAKELEEKKKQYEDARKTLDPKLADASKCQFKSLAELDQQIADLTTKTDAAAGEEKYDEALTSVNELTAKVDEKVTKAKEIEEKKAEYEKLVGEITPRMPNQCEADYPTLDPLQTELMTIEGQMKAAAEAEDYANAVTHANDLKTKLDAYEKTREELVKAKTDYDAARKSLDPKLSQAAYCSKHEELAPIEKEIETLKSQLDAAAAAKDYKKAAELCGQLSGKIDTKLSEQGRLDRQIVGSAQKERADKKLAALDEETRKRYNAVADAAKSPEERDYISKALASGHKIEDIEAFAKKINGKDKDWLQNNLKLTGQTDGKGVKQQWKHSCNATTAQALKGELDPIYSLKLHEENKDITDVDNSDGNKVNPKLAKEQKDMLESSYKGGSGGKAYDRNSSKDSGRWADDLENNMSDSTGVKYTQKLVDDAGTYKVDDAMKDVDAGLKKGHPVPLVVGQSNQHYQHYVLVTGKDKGPPETWTIHDPWDGVTVKRTTQDIKDGKINLAGATRITGLDNPATKE